MKKRKINYKRLIICIVVLIIILLIVLIGFMINNVLENKENKANIKEYKLDDILENTNNTSLIIDYNTFYTIESISNEIFELIVKSAYQDVCALMGDEIIYNKSEIEIVDLLKEYNEILDNSASVSSYYLSYVYRYSNNMYLCKININDRLINLLLELDEEDNTYKIVFIEKWS